MRRSIVISVGDRLKEVLKTESKKHFDIRRVNMNMNCGMLNA